MRPKLFEFLKQFFPTRRAFWRDSQASSVIEFAIIAPILVSFTMGIIEFSRYAYTQSALDFAAEEATRFAIVNGGTASNTDILNRASDAMLFLDSNLSAICVLSPTDTVANTSTVSITISYTYNPIFPLVLDTMTLEGTSSGYISFSPVDEDSNQAGNCASP